MITTHKLQNVLIAEDDDFLAEIIQDEVAKHVQNAHIVSDGGAAIEAIEHQMPDLLILDLLMPKINGFAVLEHLQKQKSTLPVIILSNLSDTANREKCEKLGYTKYLVKSDMDESDLWPAIERQLQ